MISEQFLSESIHRTNRSLMRVQHALSQLNDQELWWRPHSHMNSIGHLILHLEGNLTQWIIDPLNNNSNHREREKEFSATQNLSIQEAVQLANDLSVQVKKAMQHFSAEKLGEGIKVQNRKTTYLSAIYAAITHLEGHVGQIMYITRQLKGDDYQLFDHYGLNEQLGNYQNPSDQ